MLFVVRHSILPEDFLAPGHGFKEADFFLPSLDFRMKVQTRERRDEIDEVFFDILISSIISIEPPPTLTGIFRDPDEFKAKNRALRPGFEPEDLLAEFVRFPDDYWQFVKEVRTRLDRRTLGLFATLAWRLGIRGGPDRFESDLNQVYYLPEGDIRAVDPTSHRDWAHLPHGLRVGSHDGCLMADIDDEIRQEIEGLFSDDLLPLGQDLLLEAWRVLESNPRSAVTTALAAAETRLKELIVAVEPSTQWLLEELPSPPLVKMIRSYLPKLRSRFKLAGAPMPPPSIWKPLLQGVEARNRILHGRGREEKEWGLNRGDPRMILEAASDFVYLCDYYSGHEWAWDRISEGVRRDLERKG